MESPGLDNDAKENVKWQMKEAHLLTSPELS
jgi:hypothetical protein